MTSTATTQSYLGKNLLITGCRSKDKLGWARNIFLNEDTALFWGSELKLKIIIKQQYRLGGSDEIV